MPGAEGDLGVLPGHSPLIATVRPGVIRIYEDGAVKTQIFVAGGICEISEKSCTVLANEAMPIDEIDRSIAEQRIIDAKKIDDGADIILKKQADVEVRVAEAMLLAVAE